MSGKLEWEEGTFEIGVFDKVQKKVFRHNTEGLVSGPFGISGEDSLGYFTLYHLPTGRTVTEAETIRKLKNIAGRLVEETEGGIEPWEAEDPREVVSVLAAAASIVLSHPIGRLSSRHWDAEEGGRR